MRLSSSRLLAPFAVIQLAIVLSLGLPGNPAHAEATVPATTGPGIDFPSPATIAPLADLKAGLDHVDQLAVLEAIHVGLTDAPDGSTYMWRRHNGKIAGSVRPTASFRDAGGKVCRFLVFQLLLGEHMRQIEGIACRQDDRSWVLEG